MEKILPQGLVAKYLRKRAWQGTSDQELQTLFDLLALMMVYMRDASMDFFSVLRVYDYRYFLYQLGEKLKIDINSEEVRYFFDFFQSFYHYLQSLGYEDFSRISEKARASFFIKGHFEPPSDHEIDEFSAIFSHLEDITEEEAEALNLLLEQFLGKMMTYFQQSEFLLDITRAMALFGGPFWEEAKNDEDFWFSFWDFFFFDYHLISNDLTPVRYFHQEKYDTLQPSERLILNDLLKARFAIFSIEYLTEDSVICQDLFTQESYELPMPDFNFKDAKKVLLYGHLHVKDGMMLNYIASVTASPRLRKRIQEEILRQYEIYRLQEPTATLHDFFARHAAAVRHTIHILASFAQLKVVPSAFLRHSQGIAEKTEAMLELEEKIRQEALQLGFSCHSVKLMLRLYEDFLGQMKSPDLGICQEAAAAVLCLFLQINGLEYIAPSEVLACFSVEREAVFVWVDRIRTTLACENLDPRYLNEEGFVQALYMI